MTDHRWSELAAAYPLDALSPDEREELEAHLAECAECRVEVQELREAAGLLAYAAPAVAPPPGLRERVTAEARRVRPAAHRRVTPLPWLLAAAALLLALVMWNRYRTERAERVATLAHLDATRARLDSTRAQLDSTGQLVATILDSAVGTAELAAMGKAPSMRLYWNRVRNAIVVGAFDLPPAPTGRTYQLWAIRKGRSPVSLGTFNTTPGGRAVVTVRMPAGFTPELSAVTEEPAGGSPQPTQQPFLAGAWQAGR